MLNGPNTNINNMALPGLDEKFDRRANTKQITGAGGLPLRTDSRDVLVNRPGPDADNATVVIDGHNLLNENQGGDGTLTIERDSTLGANIAFLFIESADDTDFRVDFTAQDEDDNILVDEIIPHMAKRTRVYDSIPLVGDNFQLSVLNETFGVQNEINGVIYFTTGDMRGHADSNKVTVNHGQQTAGSDNTTLAVSGLGDLELPDGASLAIKSLGSNSGNIFAGSARHSGGVTSANGFELTPGDGIGDIRVNDATEVEVFIPTSGDGFCWMVEHEFSRQ